MAKLAEILQYLAIHQSQSCSIEGKTQPDKRGWGVPETPTQAQDITTAEYSITHSFAFAESRLCARERESIAWSSDCALRLLPSYLCDRRISNMRPADSHEIEQTVGQSSGSNASVDIGNWKQRQVVFLCLSR